MRLVDLDLKAVEFREARFREAMFTSYLARGRSCRVRRRRFNLVFPGNEQAPQQLSDR